MDKLNLKQREALELAKQNKNIFITGSAGTGKSFLVSYITDYFNSINKKYSITSTTGCSAVLINAQTINSYLCLGLNTNTAEFIYDKYKLYLNKIVNLETLIIDEISMMNDKLLEKIHDLLCIIKKNKKPYGGIQIIFVGDFCQLPPVDGAYCFQSSLWNNLELNIIILDELMRQKGDIEFQLILEEIRSGKCSDKTYEILKKMKDTKFENGIKPTKLFSLNINVDAINKRAYDKLLIENKGFSKTYIPKSSKKNVDLKEFIIELTINAQIIITRNIDLNQGLFNGTRGIITELRESNVVIKDINNNIHIIEYYTDRNENDNNWISFMPIKLAYALSIHKSQGATIDALELDLGNDIFVAGQLYTALSRGKSLQSIKIKNIDRSSFITNNLVKNFYGL